MDKNTALRIVALTRDIMDVLVERYGKDASLLEVYLSLHAQESMLREEPMTVTSLATKSGLAKSTVSAVVRRKPFLRLVPNPRDDRSKLIEVEDPEARLAYLGEVAAVLIGVRDECVALGLLPSAEQTP